MRMFGDNQVTKHCSIKMELKYFVPGCKIAMYALTCTKFNTL